MDDKWAYDFTLPGVFSLQKLKVFVNVFCIFLLEMPKYFIFFEIAASKDF